MDRKDLGVVVRRIGYKYRELEKSGEWLEFCDFVNDAIYKKNGIEKRFCDDGFILSFDGREKKFVKFEKVCDFDLYVYILNEFKISFSCDELIGKKNVVCLCCNGKEIFFENGKKVVDKEGGKE